jgi:hypothetical protein
VGKNQLGSSNLQTTVGSHLQRPNHQQPVEWWDSLVALGIEPNYFTWNHYCSFCDLPLLLVEDDGWYCHKGKYQQERLPPYPELFFSELK